MLEPVTRTETETKMTPIKRHFGVAFALFLSALWLPAANKLPVTDIKIMQLVASDIAVEQGAELQVGSTATDADGNLALHAIELRSPGGDFEALGDSTPGTTTLSQKGATVALAKVGVYYLRSAALDEVGKKTKYSRELKITVKPPAVTPPVERPPVVVPPAVTPSASDRFGPTFEQLFPGAPDTRASLYFTPDKPATLVINGWKMTYDRCDPYNIGVEDGDQTDYWSCSGQVAYYPKLGSLGTYTEAEKSFTAPLIGLDRVATFAHYDGVFSTSPRLDKPSGFTRPDHCLAGEPRYRDCGQPLGIVRNGAALQNDALVITEKGRLLDASTQTGRPGDSWPLPYLQLPANKKATGGIAVTTGNEFAVITVEDTETHKGQLAVVALEGKWLQFHTWPYLGLFNHGSFSDFKLLGFVDLSIAHPDSVGAASNGFWESPGQTNNKSLGQLPLTANLRQTLQNPNGEYGWIKIVATGGYAIVASKQDSALVVVDLSPVFQSFRDAWLKNFDATVVARADGTWPNSTTMGSPKEVWSTPVTHPTSVLAGQLLDRWSADRFKAYVGDLDGNVTIVDTSSLMHRWDWEKNSPIAVIGSIKVGPNITSMCFDRFGENVLPLIPPKHNCDPLNNLFWVCSRGNRTLYQVVTHDGNAAVVREVTDKHMGDPVGLGMADRAKILSVACGNQEKWISFRIGGLQAHSGAWYGAGADGTAYAEFCGETSVPGFCFAVSSANVN